jgi:hypothetical protein
MSTTENGEVRFRLTHFCDLPDDGPPDESRWGGWHRRGKRALVYRRDEYEVDLITCTSSAEVLDWVAQVAQKDWATTDCVGGLCRAFDDIFNLQSTLCGCGHDRRLTKTEIRRMLGMA